MTTSRSILRSAACLGSILASSSLAPNRAGTAARTRPPPGPAVRRGPLHTLGGSANDDSALSAGSFPAAPAASREDDLERTFQVICDFIDEASDADGEEELLTPTTSREDDLESTFKALPAFHDDQHALSSPDPTLSAMRAATPTKPADDVVETVGSNSPPAALGIVRPIAAPAAEDSRGGTAKEASPEWKTSAWKKASSYSPPPVKMPDVVPSGEVPALLSSPPRTVCLMVEPSPFSHMSGYANRFKEMLRCLRLAGDEVDILTTPTDPDEPMESLPKEEAGYEIHYTRGFTFPFYKAFSLTFDVPDRVGSKLIKNRRPDLIHSISPGFLLFASIYYARRHGVPLVMSYHTHLPVYARTYRMGLLESASWLALRVVHSLADLTLTTSPQLADELREHGIPRVGVWRKGIDVERFHPRFRSDEFRRTRMMAEDAKDTDFLLAYIGRLGAEKRLHEIRDMMDRLPDDVRLCVVGKGPEESRLRELLDPSRTVFTGQLGGDDLSSAFASADCFVMPSDSETLGFVVLESMASGVPVVGCDAGGIPDLIRDGDTGYLVAAGDVDGYVDRIGRLYDSREAREGMSKRAREETERWSWEAATSLLRNDQYQMAIDNFERRRLERSGNGGRVLWQRLRVNIVRQWTRLRGLFRRLRENGGSSDGDDSRVAATR